MQGTSVSEQNRQHAGHAQLPGGGRQGVGGTGRELLGGLAS